MLTHEQIEAKVRGAIQALSQMTPKERELVPTSTYGREYNNTRSAALKLYPHLRDALPAEVEIFTSMQGGEISRARYVELHTYYEQLLNLLFLEKEKRK